MPARFINPHMVGPFTEPEIIVFESGKELHVGWATEVLRWVDDWPTDDCFDGGELGSWLLDRTVEINCPDYTFDEKWLATIVPPSGLTEVTPTEAAVWIMQRGCDEYPAKLTEQLTEHSTAPPRAADRLNRSTSPLGTRKEQERVRWLAEAMLLVQKRPDLADREIAQMVGKNPSTLSRSNEYRAAAELARGPRQAHRNGFIKSGEPGCAGDIECIDGR